MSYNPQIHHRRSIRLKGYDYSQAGLYFITICCADRKHRFGEIVGAGFTPARDENGKTIIEGDKGQPQGIIPTITPTIAAAIIPTDGRTITPTDIPMDAKMILNDFGTIAYNEWIKLTERFTNFELDVFQIMPNHMHGIIMLKDVGTTISVAQNDGVDGNGAPARGAPTVGDIVGAYKSLVANACIDICNAKNIRLGKLWQRNFYEHVIRNEQSYHTISEYIINNPAKWAEDKFYTK